MFPAKKLVVEVACQGYKTSKVKTIIVDAREGPVTEHLNVSLRKPTIWDYVLPLAAAIAVVRTLFIIRGLAGASKK